jgi:hypothetical protein
LKPTDLLFTSSLAVLLCVFFVQFTTLPRGEKKPSSSRNSPRNTPEGFFFASNVLLDRYNQARCQKRLQHPSSSTV